jgi:hypothetical protein
VLRSELSVSFCLKLSGPKVKRSSSEALIKADRPLLLLPSVLCLLFSDIFYLTFETSTKGRL